MNYGEDIVTENGTAEKSVNDIKYEQYLASDDKTKTIDGVLYYKAVSVEYYSNLLNGETLDIVLPSVMFKNVNMYNICVMNEAGKSFKLIGPALLSFHGNGGVIPEWYRNCAVFLSTDNVCPEDAECVYFTVCNH